MFSFGRKKMRSWTDGLNGRTAVVTGASRGLGAAISVALAEAGATVYAVARSKDELDAIAKESSAIRPWVADIREAAFLEALEKGEPDILVNNAGTNTPMPMPDVPVALLDELLNMNVRSTYLVSQAAVRSMLRRKVGGVIVNITSQLGHVGQENRTVYCMAKHGIEGLTKAMAVEFAAHGIRVNSVAPTVMETSLTTRALEDPFYKEKVINNIPLGRLGNTEDVAAAVVYLASPAASMVTGISLKVDGGWTAQ